MATIEKDSVSGQNTTGHEWDGIKELNTPLPKWWVYVFWATVVWAVGYWVAYPAWPLANGFTKGLLGYSSRGELDNELAAQKKSRSAWLSKIEASDVAVIEKDKDLLRYAMAGGKIAFNENCGACHGVGGVGAYGYPTLADDEWLWGGTLADIEQTIKFGVRNANANSRQSEMPKFGVDGVLKPEQISSVADYVLSLASKAPAKGSAGETVYAENCAVCHAEDGSGMAAVGAPALNNQIWLYKGTKDAIVAQVTKPKHGSMPAWSERLDASTIKMLAVYVHNLGGGK
ncbi:Cytochrome c oxidase subunit CcoP [Paramagnetospirillum magnetotacticum MS-1]|uniref:Cbb3-type cytochrome c oxidase subunit n=2 Tax=Paramagnetospirillum magnetotacticum TaxID=188 RepID=A0A0C2YEC5_PARME|nr:cytochrome-c oxidase, cbb3-type subunit III [Paramagnetospirillum magnetotacticum]KIL98054.1 Cytochrome c oxidase subunit CcoP [Paramagnetospirillum magnetotacticum MS-1]BAA75505.1 cb-type cytochrome c oxidase CcoP subunit [Paramagnetospirillum magnetotacticum]